MKTLSSFLRNPFDDPALSYERLVVFTTDHLQRMGANNASALLTERISATQSAYDAVAACNTDDQVNFGLRKARKKAKMKFRKQTVPSVVERIEAGLIAAYSSDSPVLWEALPKGRNIFNICRDDELEVYLRILHSAVTAHAVDLAPVTLTLATTLMDDWQATHTASESSTGAKAKTGHGKQQARDHLQLMLFLNLLKISELFPRQPKKLSLYMQQHLLEIPQSSAGEDGAEPPL